MVLPSRWGGCSTTSNVHLFMEEVLFEQAPNLHAGHGEGRAEPKVAQKLVVLQSPRRLSVFAELSQKRWGKSSGGIAVDAAAESCY